MDYADQQRLLQQNNDRVQGNDAYAQSFMNEQREAVEREEAAREADADRVRQARQAQIDANFSSRVAAKNRSWFGGSRRSKKSRKSRKSKKSRKSRKSRR